MTEPIAPKKGRKLGDGELPRGRRRNHPRKFDLRPKQECGPVRVRRLDGSGDIYPALTGTALQAIVRDRRIPPKLRGHVLRRDWNGCRYCQHPAEAIDHVVPVALGGGARAGNLVAACTDCNSRKGATIWRPTPLAKHRRLLSRS